MRRYRPLFFLAGLLVLLLVATPTLGANPGGKPAKAEKGPAIARTLTGTIVAGTDAKGRATYEMTVETVTWELSAGPKWYWAGSNPLAAYVGAEVEVAGTYREGSHDLSVATINGTAVRAAGRPPWAGGPKVVGESHPGWKDATGSATKANPGKGQGREHAPGQNKLKAHGRATAPGQNKVKTGNDADD